MQDYFGEKYNRETKFIPNGINRPEIRTADLISQQYGLEKMDIYFSLQELFRRKGYII